MFRQVLTSVAIILMSVIVPGISAASGAPRAVGRQTSIKWLRDLFMK